MNVMNSDEAEMSVCYNIIWFCGCEKVEIHCSGICTTGKV